MKTLPRLLSLSAVTALLIGCEAGPYGDVAVKPSHAAPVMTETSEPMASKARISPVVHPMPHPGPKPRRGVVTAGDIDDGLNLAAFLRYQKRMAGRTGLASVVTGKPVHLQLVNASGQSAPGVAVNLRKPGAKEPFYSGYSGVDGRVLVFPAVHGAGAPTRVEIGIIDEKQAQLRQTVRAGVHEQIAISAKGGWSPQFLDLAFVIDVSGSMGDEIAWLEREFAGLVSHAREAAPGISLRFGLVAYQSPGDFPPVRSFGFTTDATEMQRWIGSLRATGGLGGDELVGAGMEAAVELNWRRGRGERLIFQIGDEPPSKAGARRLARAARDAARKNVQIFGLGASGAEEEFELLLRQAAVQTGGRYLFLTDDSGVGLPHGEPNVACYRVTLLKSLLKRVLASELTGVRKEASKGEVIRSVGTYRDGVCLQ
ncbi:VWA domain-containing protein [Alisedimentitalea sp. MJ-SS2]|uniref:vWA domain-containing protein n=1 Tax=Aliisedimentitalea sp. MJ-SS2 TaxID=3049795 RepID=UPI002907C22F|nr:VWA domain-containing protein [Alisedimentitalea sp. MJ-SS2]MDU8928447.1 VWA domain-containing protein [Alisedimentitalea sp. MJ-SS2]